MKKEIINVPSDVIHLTDWTDFKLLDFPHILDKQITGCGFTEWVIRNPQNMILCSPRVVLLENKEDQHEGEVLYLKNTYTEILEFEKDLTKEHRWKQEKVLTPEEQSVLNRRKAENATYLRNQVREYFMMCQFKSKPTKILVTYDSYRLVYEALTELGVFDSFYTVVDEFQSVFTDSRFKPDTELGFVGLLQKVQKLCFVSATPMIEKYLDMLDEFKDLPMICLDWGALNPTRISRPLLNVHPCQRITETAVSIINKYLNGDFEYVIIEDEAGNLTRVVSDQMIIYVNSVKNICDIINKAKLTFENTNVLCSVNPDNVKKIRKAFGLKRGQEGGIGKVPKKGEVHKMFTLCTRTVYLGADFYSPCARSFIFSDANIECLAVDITLDLPQIMGRQRLEENPWKNQADLYVKILSSENIKSAEDFKDFQEEKIKRTNNLLSAYSTAANSEIQHDVAYKYRKSARNDNYRDDYLAVNTHAGSDLLPEFNNLVMISEFRAFEIQQIDYKDRFYVNTAIEGINRGYVVKDGSDSEVDTFLKDFDVFKSFTDKIKYLCENTSESILPIVLPKIPKDMKSYYITLGPQKLKALGYQKSRIVEAMEKILIERSGSVKSIILSAFSVGDKILKSDIKKSLQELYKREGIVRVAKASDIGDCFEIKDCKITDKLTGKRSNGYEILSIKEDNGE